MLTAHPSLNLDSDHGMLLCFVFVKLPDVLKVSFPLECCYANTTILMITNHVTCEQTLTLVCAQYDTVMSQWNTVEGNLRTNEEKHVDYMQ